MSVQQSKFWEQVFKLKIANDEIKWLRKHFNEAQTRHSKELVDQAEAKSKIIRTLQDDVAHLQMSLAAAQMQDDADAGEAQLKIIELEETLAEADGELESTKEEIGRLREEVDTQKHIFNKDATQFYIDVCEFLDLIHDDVDGDRIASLWKMIRTRRDDSIEDQRQLDNAWNSNTRLREQGDKDKATISTLKATLDKEQEHSRQQHHRITKLELFVNTANPLIDELDDTIQVAHAELGNVPYEWKGAESRYDTRKLLTAALEQIADFHNSGIDIV